MGNPAGRSASLDQTAMTDVLRDQARLQRRARFTWGLGGWRFEVDDRERLLVRHRSGAVVVLADPNSDGNEG